MGRIEWHALVTEKPAECAAFLAELLAWRVEGQTLYAGTLAIGQVVTGAGPTTWHPCVTVSDASESFEPVRDPGGAVCWTWWGPRAPHPDEGGVVPRGTVCWNELRTSDPAAARSFYADRFGWTPRALQPNDPDEYVFLTRAENRCETAIRRTTDVRNSWIAYVLVDDTDDVVVRAQERGATVVEAPSTNAGGREAVLEYPAVGRFGVKA